MTEEKIIMYDSAEAATYKTDIKGWVSSDGRYYGDNEDIARYAGCTHKKCDCGNIHEKGRTKCNACIAKSQREKYNNLPFEEWDGLTPLVLFRDDQYFFDEDSIEEYCEENNVKFEDLMLVICEPNNYYQINSDYWEDILPEDDNIDPKLEEKLKELNKFIKTLPPASWGEGKLRTSYKPQV